MSTVILRDAPFPDDAASVSSPIGEPPRPVRLSARNWREPAIRMHRNLGFAEAEPWDRQASQLRLKLV